jgi:hypothetical protein
MDADALSQGSLRKSMVFAQSGQPLRKVESLIHDSKA